MLENHAWCVGAQVDQNPLAVFYGRAKRGKQRESKAKKEVRCNDSLLFLFFPPVELQGKRLE